MKDLDLVFSFINGRRKLPCYQTQASPNYYGAQEIILFEALWESAVYKLSNTYMYIYR